jgi:hypothetical protein
MSDDDDDDFLGRKSDGDALRRLEEQAGLHQDEDDSAAAGAADRDDVDDGGGSSALKRGWLVETKTNTRWRCFLRPGSLDMFDSMEASQDPSNNPQRTIPLTVCSSVQLGGLLQNTLRLGAGDQETRVLCVWSDYATSTEFRCVDVQDCNAWFNSLSRVVGALHQTELASMAENDDEDMMMRFRHARLWALGKVSAPDEMPRSQWMASDAVTYCSFCEESFQSDFKKHHCRLCGAVYCSAHSKKARDLEFSEAHTKVPFRVCVWCHLIWRDYAQGVMDGDRDKTALVGPLADADVPSELNWLRDFRRDQAKKRAAALAAADAAAAASPGGRRVSISRALGSIVTKISGAFGKGGGRGTPTHGGGHGGHGGAPGSGGGGGGRRGSAVDMANDLASNPFGEDDDEGDAVLMAAAAERPDDEDDGRDGTSAQLAVLDNLLTVSTNNSQWMKKAEQSMHQEEVDFLDLRCARALAVVCLLSGRGERAGERGY